MTSFDHHAELESYNDSMRECLTEFDQAHAIANKILDRSNADPDDDMAVLARQFLRSDSNLRERLKKLSNEVLGILPLMEEFARSEFGNTNYNILIQRAEEARAALTPPSDHQSDAASSAESSAADCPPPPAEGR